jgi:hypothetical protein
MEGNTMEEMKLMIKGMRSWWMALYGVYIILCIIAYAYTLGVFPRSVLLVQACALPVIAAYAVWPVVLSKTALETVRLFHKETRAVGTWVFLMSGVVVGIVAALIEQPTTPLDVRLLMFMLGSGGTWLTITTLRLLKGMSK